MSKPDDDCTAEHLLDNHHGVLKYCRGNYYCQLFFVITLESSCLVCFCGKVRRPGCFGKRRVQIIVQFVIVGDGDGDIYSF